MINEQLIGKAHAEETQLNWENIGREVMLNCQRCGTELKHNYCQDETCPFVECLQDDRKGWIGHSNPPPITEDERAVLTETQVADLGYIVKYAESTRDSLKKRGEQPQSMLLMNLDRIIQMSEGLRDQLS